MLKHNLYATPFSKVYPYYIAKAERKGRTKAEVDEIIRWLTGYTRVQFQKHLEKGTTFKAHRHITKAVEEIEDRVMREIRYLDKLIDELAKGRPMEKILRK